MKLDKKTVHTREKGSEQANGQLCIGNQDILFHIHNTNMLISSQDCLIFTWNVEELYGLLQCNVLW